MEMTTMLKIEINVFDEQIEYEYLVPIEAIKQYLETDSMIKVKEFLREEYTSNDTDNILNLCMMKGFNYELVHKEIAGTWN